MVRVVNPDGSWFEEPPYTEEEQLEMYRSSAMGPRSSFTRPAGPTKPAEKKPEANPTPPAPETRP
jgi:hypothetical protein